MSQYSTTTDSLCLDHTICIIKYCDLIGLIVVFVVNMTSASVTYNLNGFALI